MKFTIAPFMLLGGALFAPASSVAQTSDAGPARPPALRAAPAIRAEELDGHLRFLSSDLLEGRAPATRGDLLTTEYLAAQLRIAGVSPGVDTSYFQAVPIDVVGAEPATIRVAASPNGGAPVMLRYPDDVVVWAGSATESSAARGELVFVGYGSTAPEFRWDDFKDLDVRGKVLLVLVNDPPAPPSEPALFGGRAMTYYGRWTYKFEEAERRGAAGMLIVHTTERAGYPWHTVVGSWAKEQRMLPRHSSRTAPLGVQGWITDSAATALLARRGMDLQQLRVQAESRDFRPVATGITLDVSMRNRVEHLSTRNVVGVVRGRDPKLRNEYVVYSAHWDHLGIGPPVRGDSIYNGAEDNASGTASVLAIAHAAAHGPKPRRSMLFVFVTAEESGLLGSEFFAQNPVVPVEKLVANINIDVAPVLGRVRNLDVLGDRKSSLGPMLERLVRPHGIRLSPEERPEAGHFYRSDHFSFAKAGVPAISIGPGTDYVGRPPGWGAARDAEWTAQRYHQPSDEYRASWDLSGMVQLSEIALALGRSLANSSVMPTWNADAEFRRAVKGAPAARTTAR